MEDRFPVGRYVTVCGEVFRFRQRFQMNHPKSAPGMVPHQFSGIMPIYSERGTLKRDSIARIVGSALQVMPAELDDPLPTEILKSYNFPTLADAIKALHQPKGDTPECLAALEVPRHRLIFTELLCAQIGLAQLQSQRQRQPGPSINGTLSVSKAQKRFSFQLTAAQTRTLDDIFSDMRKGIPMGRLLQGDVGSGKTAVAIGACDGIISKGFQCAVMAPTEILAEQHYKSFTEAFNTSKDRVALLTASTKPAARRLLLEQIYNGHTQILIGTHALLNDKVIFQNLGLTVVDEQHRFGVSQRARLRAKGLNARSNYMPHFLAMTATPIPVVWH